MATPSPPKLRSACTECHASKVKRSGEKTGCMRCRNLGLKCHFEISMVGKCSRVRKRRRQPMSDLSGHGQYRHQQHQEQHHQQHHQQQHQLDITEDSVIACAPSTSTSTLENLAVVSAQQERSPLLPDWTERTSFDMVGVTSPSLILDDLRHSSMFSNATLCEQNLETFLSSCHDQCESLFSLSLEESTASRNVPNRNDSIMSEASDTEPTDQTIVQVRQPSLHCAPQPPESQQGTPQPQQSHSVPVAQGANDSSSKQHTATSLQVYFRMITGLEERLKYRASSVDEVMHTSKTCSEQLWASMQLDGFLYITAGPMLVLTAIELMTLLLESSIPRLLLVAENGSFPEVAASAADGGGTLKSASATAATLPSLALGNFHVDPEEVGLIWRHVISGELRRVLRLIDAIGAYQENPPLRADRPSIRSGISYQVLCEGLKQRIKMMISSIGDPREGRRLDMF